MGAVVCAVRGGPHSQPTIRRAIQLARETQNTLIFAYIINLDFLSYTSSSGTQTLVDDMKNMGEFILLMAQAQAQKEGVSAQTAIREGSLEEELIALCRESDADYLVLGRPGHSSEQNVFSGSAFQDFILNLERAADVRVILADD